MKYTKQLILFTLFAMNLVEQPALEVTIEQGILIGKISPDGSFFEYVGIPYATTNSTTRFKAPLPPPSWEGVFRAVDEIDSCPQASPVKILGVLGTEDCLKINVYVPVFAVRPIPVMVFIHGGAFILGSGGKLLYAPDFLVKQNVIVVTFNYRLGAFGFICLGIKEAPGNAGLKDQIAALRWIKKNIAAFGGDPDNVTIFGQSAGGTSVSLLLASEATNGLFSKIIVQSGSSIASWSVNRQPVWTASLITKELGYKTEDPKEIYDILSRLPFEDIVRVKVNRPLGKFLDTELLYLPCVEKDIPGEEAALTDLPYNLLINKPKNIPAIYGSTSNEGLFIVAKDTEKTLAERDKRYLFATDLEFPSEDIAERENTMARELYFGKEKMSLKNLMNSSTLIGQLYFELPPILESEIVINKTNASIYNYHFNYSGGRNFLKILSGYKDEPGACHADEILYLFRGDMWPFPINKKDQQMINWMTKMWTNFAKYGDPTPESSKDLPVRWKPSSKEGLNFLYIEDELKIGPIPHSKAYNLWKYIYEMYRKKYIENY